MDGTKRWKSFIFSLHTWNHIFGYQQTIRVKRSVLIRFHISTFLNCPLGIKLQSALLIVKSQRGNEKYLLPSESAKQLVSSFSKSMSDALALVCWGVTSPVATIWSYGLGNTAASRENILVEIYKLWPSFENTSTLHTSSSKYKGKSTHKYNVLQKNTIYKSVIKYTCIGTKFDRNNFTHK